VRGWDYQAVEACGSFFSLEDMFFNPPSNFNIIAEQATRRGWDYPAVQACGSFFSLEDVFFNPPYNFIIITV
jgi:predicted FMN-binding regulatory protein PaiB